ncbi:hypothetical protein M9Y10_015503 [Tritrichomonas musculus]|uniref:Uncharacterized protein n=1 Tax=Tritrichomonas musculus TaxID=1915356 RepID=A0ABR2L3E9_9EUKA
MDIRQPTMENSNNSISSETNLRSTLHQLSISELRNQVLNLRDIFIDTDFFDIFIEKQFDQCEMFKNLYIDIIVSPQLSLINSEKIWFQDIFSEEINQCLQEYGKIYAIDEEFIDFIFSLPFADGEFNSYYWKYRNDFFSQDSIEFDKISVKESDFNLFKAYFLSKFTNQSFDITPDFLKVFFECFRLPCLVCSDYAYDEKYRDEIRAKVTEYYKDFAEYHIGEDNIEQIIFRNVFKRCNLDDIEEVYCKVWGVITDSVISIQ